MEDCKTPSIEELAGLKFQFIETPTTNHNNLNKNNNQSLNIANNNNNNVDNKNDKNNILSVLPHKLRCYTPGGEDMNSPNISPVFYTNNGKPNFATINEQLQLQQQTNNDSSNSPSMNLSGISPSTNNNSTDSNDSDLKLSLMTSILNQSLTVERMLMIVGLEEYTERFEKAGIDIVKFPSITPYDLYKVGLDCDKHYKLVLELVARLNNLI